MTATTVTNTETCAYMGASILFYLYSPPSENTFLPEGSLTPSKRINFQKSFKPCVGKNIARRVWKALLKKLHPSLMVFWSSGHHSILASVMLLWPGLKHKVYYELLTPEKDHGHSWDYRTHCSNHTRISLLFPLTLVTTKGKFYIMEIVWETEMGVWCHQWWGRYRWDLEHGRSMLKGETTFQNLQNGRI